MWIIRKFFEAQPEEPLAPLFEPRPSDTEDAQRSPSASPCSETAKLPLSRRLKLACEALPLSKNEKRIVDALIEFPGADSKALSDACGWPSGVWHMHFVALCQKRKAWLLPAGSGDLPDAEFLPSILVDYDPHRCTFRLRSSVEPAFREMGFGQTRMAS